jgi:hypothetical protein
VLFSSAPQASNRRRHEAPRAAQHRRPSAHDARDRVVDPGLDRAVVQQEDVGDPREPLQRVVVAERDRLVADVAARQHERHAGVAEQQVVQRRVGEHHAQFRHAGRDPVGDRRARGPRRQHDRPRRRRQQRHVLLAERHERTRRRHVRRHERERPVLAVLTGAQPRDRRAVVGTTREMDAADALHRDDRARDQRPRSALDVVAAAGRVADQPHPRAAGRTRVRLRVEAAVGRVVVLRPARAAHREPRHRRQGPVVGDPAHDGEPRAAVRAVDERIPEAPVAGIAQLRQAVPARRGISRHQRRGRPAGRPGDREARVPARLDVDRSHRLDDGERRRLVAQRGEEPVDGLGAALCLDLDAAGVVADEAGKPVLRGGPMHERAEPDPLHDALHPHVHTACGRVNAHRRGRLRVSDRTRP